MAQHQVHEVLVPNLAVPPHQPRRSAPVVDTVIAAVVIVPWECHVEIVDHPTSEHPMPPHLLNEHAIERLHLAWIECQVPSITPSRDGSTVEHPRHGVATSTHFIHDIRPEMCCELGTLCIGADAGPVAPVVQAGVEDHDIWDAVTGHEVGPD